MTAFAYTCANIQAVAPDISIIHVKPQTHTFIRHIPGQYVEVYLSAGIWLALSVACPPQADGQLEFHIRHNVTHPWAQVLLKELHEKGELQIRGPFGKFTQTQAHGKSWLFMAGGTGFAPMNAILTSLFTQTDIPHCHLYWGIKRSQDAYALQQLQEWQQTIPHFNFTLVLSEPKAHTSWEGPVGLVHEHVMAMNKDLSQTSVFACGPYPMLIIAREEFQQLGLSRQEFISDL